MYSIQEKASIKTSYHLVIGKIAFFSSGLSFDTWTVRWRSKFGRLLVKQRVRATICWYSKDDLVRGRTLLQEMTDRVILGERSIINRLVRAIILYMILTRKFSYNSQLGVVIVFVVLFQRIQRRVMIDSGLVSRMIIVRE